MQFHHKLITLHYYFTVALMTLFWVVSGHVVVSNTIVVDKAGRGNFTTLQQAIDSIPHNNTNWIRVHVKAGIYTEKVSVPEDKQFIVVEGESRANTVIQWGDAGDVVKSTTFTILADNFVAKNITFKNTYNNVIARDEQGKGITWAPAALIAADKVSLYSCGIVSIQDTLSDARGRHFFDSCHIQGAIDFIWGSGQSFYKGCYINVTTASLPAGEKSYITAQGRESADETSGFVFHSCSVIGTGPAFLGRAYRNYSTVVFYKTLMDNIIAPDGWSAWHNTGHEELITYAEEGCSGAGSDMSKRVKWEKKLTPQELNKFTDINSFINQDGWLQNQPS